MKQLRPYPLVTVSKKAERSVVGGHPWIYDTEILEMPEMVSASSTLASTV